MCVFVCVCGVCVSVCECVLLCLFVSVFGVCVCCMGVKSVWYV